MSGCGQAQPDLSNGKKLFTSTAQCGSCHTLARANTKGAVGPDLDDAFRSARQDGMGASVIQGVVHNQIEYPRKGSLMPAKLATGENARDIAAYVAAVAGKPGKDTGDLASVGTVNTANKLTTEKNGTLTIPADPTGALAFSFGKATATAGKVTIQMPNQSPIQHNIALKTPPGNGPIVGHGGTSSFSITLKPGTYEFYCQVPGHEQAGMKGTLTVK
jgi:plastocyanin